MCRKHPELNVAMGFVLIVFGLISLWKRVSGEPYHLGWMFGYYFGFTVGMVLLGCGLSVLRGRPVIVRG